MFITFHAKFYQIKCIFYLSYTQNQIEKKEREKKNAQPISLITVMHVCVYIYIQHYKTVYNSGYRKIG